MNKKLIVFLRKPILGRVKTRLSSSIGDKKALSVYRWLVDLTLDVVDQIEAECHYYFDEIDENFTAKEGQIISVQRGTDLGEKMGHALTSCLSSLGAKAVVIGSDCPEINAEVIDEAYGVLDKYDVVIGPALDGGIYLLGLKHFSSDLFNEVKWGSSEVCRVILSNISKLNLSVLVLGPMRDIDESSDLRLFESKYKAYQLKNMADVF